MQHTQLIIGNKNYSSWSLRIWLLLKASNVDFDETLIQLFDPMSKPILDKYSVTGKVPVLIVHDTESSLLNTAANQSFAITESLAIALYANDYLTDLDIWSGQPKSTLNKQNQQQRAFCQSIVSEMSTGFMGIRHQMPMNIRAKIKVDISEACRQDIARIENIFVTCLQMTANHTDTESTGHYLFGAFTIADAWYAPVLLRLNSYAAASGLLLKPSTQQYINTMLANPHMQAWQQAALQETRIVDQDEGEGEVISRAGVLA